MSNYDPTQQQWNQFYQQRYPSPDPGRQARIWKRSVGLLLVALALAFGTFFCIRVPTANAALVGNLSCQASSIDIVTTDLSDLPYDTDNKLANDIEHNLVHQCRDGAVQNLWIGLGIGTVLLAVGVMLVGLAGSKPPEYWG
jgi:hypothetical protein